MAVSFGSVGDIIAICQIVGTLVKALNDSRGSASEYQSLAREIEALTSTLQQIQRLSSSLEAKADNSHLNKELDSCYSTLENLQLKVLKYKKSLAGTNGTGNAFRDGYLRLRYLNDKEPIAEYKQQISRHHGSIQLQMQALGMAVALADNQKVQARFDKTESMLVQIAEAVRQRQKPIRADQPTATGAVRGVLISGYVRPALRQVQAITANIPKGVVVAKPIMEGFEKAVLQCRQRCQELADRCSKDNASYRDTDFEIDVDLIGGTRNCLDSLLIDAEEPSYLEPEAVLRVRDVFWSPTFLKAGNIQDVGETMDIARRWWQAGLATALNISSLVERLCVFQDEHTGTYGFLFHRDGAWVHSVVDDNLYMLKADWDELSDEDRSNLQFQTTNITNMEKTYRDQFQTGSRSLYFSSCKDENEIWLPLIEKAYAKAHGDYSALHWGNPGEALEDLTGGVSTQIHVRDIIDKDRFWHDQFKQINKNYLFTVRTKPYTDFQLQWVSTDKTVYAPTGTSVLRTFEGFGLRLLLLRSFQNKTEWIGPWSNPSSEWTPEWMQRLNHDFANPQLFWIDYKELLRKYMYIDRTRIFDSDWTVAQQWVTVEVQQDDDYQDTSFLFTLHHKSEIVISLSQLDSRYYCGLEGLYRFQLHFHIYADGDDELITASRGNYIGCRSVSAECELPPGKYSVDLQISATKLDSAQSVTEVIAKNSRSRRSKLLQAGLQYDIAHAKALGWRPLRARQVGRENASQKAGSTDPKTKVTAESSSNKSEMNGDAKSEAKSRAEDEGMEDEEREEEEEEKAWDAICAVGLRVFSHDPGLELEVVLSDELRGLFDEKGAVSLG